MEWKFAHNAAGRFFSELRVDWLESAPQSVLSRTPRSLAMSLYRFSPCVLLLITFLAISARVAHAEEAPEWLRGAGKDLEVRRVGEVLDAVGRPARDVAVIGALNHQVSPLALEPTPSPTILN